jgi:hypothetical protein
MSKTIINKHNVVSVQTREFKKMLGELPIAEAMEKLYQAWADGKVIQTKEWAHWGEMFQAAVTPRYRALFVKESFDSAVKQGLICDKMANKIRREMDPSNPPKIWIWGWIGSHETYNNLAFQSKKAGIIRDALNRASQQNQADNSKKYRAPSI